MENNALNNFIMKIRNSWNGLNSETTLKSRELLVQLAKTSNSEPWLTKLHSEKLESVELYRDKMYGFVLLAHVEFKENYRVPHNHGTGWVLYAVQHGAMEMSTYGQISDQKGESILVSRGATNLNAGECNVYLPDDIHDTKCLSDYVLMFRLTSSDFKIERREGRLIQYVK